MIMNLLYILTSIFSLKGQWMNVGRGNEPFDNSSWKGNMLSWMCKGFVQAFDQE